VVNSLDVDISQVLHMTNEDTKKANKWLDEHNINYAERDIVEANPTYYGKINKNIGNC
jgi:hypothetical protein